MARQSLARSTVPTREAAPLADAVARRCRAGSPCARPRAAKLRWPCATAPAVTPSTGARSPRCAAIATAISARARTHALGRTISLCATVHQQIVVRRHAARDSCAALGRVRAGASRAAADPCAGKSRSTTRGSSALTSAIVIPSQGTPVSMNRRRRSRSGASRKSMLSEPSPRISLAQQMQLLERAARRGERTDRIGAVFGLHSQSARCRRTRARRSSRLRATGRPASTAAASADPARSVLRRRSDRDPTASIR